jgi:hypothetical protein
MSSALDAFLAQYSREAREISLSLRNLILEVFPNTIEQVDPKSGIIAYGFTRNTYKGLVCAIQPHMKHVNLMFNKGTQLPDPSVLLAGSGKLARHIKFRSEAETQNPELRKLLEEAIELGKKEMVHAEKH